MNAIAVLGILEKGLSLLPTLIDTGSSIIGIVNQMATVAKKAKDGEEVPKSELDALEADLDAKFAEFNAPLPPAP